ncbi:MAG: AsmA-like C-terminal region-containing protein [Cyclobacteriaceae bacterium]
MKKLKISIAVLVGITVVTLILVPVIYTEDIQKAIKTQVENTLDANFLFDRDEFSISMIKGFPNISVGIGDVGLTGKGVFEGDTLFFASQFNLSLDLMSVISGDQIKIVEVIVDKPVINILVTQDLQTNYDIVKSSESQQEVEQTSSNEAVLSVAMDHWVMTDGTIRYIDDSLPYYMFLEGVNHEGNGNFIGDVFTMVSSTEARSFSTGYDEVEYITDKQLSGDVTMEMNLETFKFIFKENRVNLNGFTCSFDGWLAMPESDIDMDITFSGQEVDLKSILSLTPGDYESYLDGVTASGSVEFEGSVKGTYSDELMPATTMSFKVDNGKIAYAEYPIPMEAIGVSAAFQMPSADLSEASFVMEKFEMLVDGEPFNMGLDFRDFDNYKWDVKVGGALDLEKITKIVPLGKMTLRGKIDAEIVTVGSMSDLEAEEYDKLPTSGSMQIDDFYYKSVDLPQGFGISRMDASFDPEKIKLFEFQANAGKTDMRLSGTIVNYLGFALGKDELLQGDFSFRSSLIDVNEWMVEDETAAEEPVSEDTSSLVVVRIPENVLFVMDAEIDQLLYDELDINSFKGKLEIKQESIFMNEVAFGLLDGSFVMNGSYDSKYEYPVYSYDLEIEGLSIANAFASFNTVQKLAPFAENMNGKFASNFAITGALDQKMMPVYETITGEGLLQIAQASLSDVLLLSTISSVTSLKETDGSVTLKDVLLNARIEKGQVEVEPFEIKLGGYTTTVSGGNSVDGALNYQLKVQSVPTGGVGQVVSSAIGSFAGVTGLSVDKVDINLGVDGSFLDPKVALLSVSAAGSKEEVTVADQAKSIGLEKVKLETKKVKQQVDSVKSVARDSASTIISDQKEAVTDAAKKGMDEAKEKAKDAVKDIFKRKKNSGGDKK